MTRIDLGLFAVVMLMALGLVMSQHKARKLYSEHERLQMVAAEHKTEYEQLQIEQSTWAMQSRVEEMAAKQLKMKVPNAKQIQVIVLDEVSE